jgi:hypothetical protein
VVGWPVRPCPPVTRAWGQHLDGPGNPGLHGRVRSATGLDSSPTTDAVGPPSARTGAVAQVVGCLRMSRRRRVVPSHGGFRSADVCWSTHRLVCASDVTVTSGSRGWATPLGCSPWPRPLITSLPAASAEHRGHRPRGGRPGLQQVRRVRLASRPARDLRRRRAEAHRPGPAHAGADVAR